MIDKQFIGVLVMLNNYFHDLAVAVLFSSIVITWMLGRQAERSGALELFRGRVLGQMYTVTKFCLAWIILGGVVRTIAYRDYEWMSAAGNNQIAALVVKHILLVGMVVVGVYMQVRLARKYR